MSDFVAGMLSTLNTYLRANVFLRSQRWDASKMPDLTGRVAIVTGGNTGIGFVCCRELAGHGAKVYMASRTESRAKVAISKIKQDIPNAQVEFLYFDLTILASVKKAADEFKNKENRLDILINNAGIMFTPYELGPDGIELQACNGTGHFALTMQLLPILKKTSSLPNTHVRVVNLSSVAHRQAKNPDFTSLDGLNGKSLTSWTRYANSKLTNLLFTNELQKLLQDTNIFCLSVHPGLVSTELIRGTKQTYPKWDSLVELVWGSLLATPYAGAQTQLYAATSPEIEEKNLKAAYLVPYGQVGRKSKLAQDAEGKLGRQFWTLCEQLIANEERRQSAP